MAQITQRGVMVKCRKCGNESNADTFQLDHEYRMVVCSNCYHRRRSPVLNKPAGFVPLSSVSTDKQVIDKIKEEHPELPVKKDPKAGWDKDDEFLELAEIRKQEEVQKFAPHVRGLEKRGSVEIKCSGCGYRFAYNEQKSAPASCPYCNRSVSDM